MTDRWRGLTQTDTQHVAATFITSSGRIRTVDLTYTDLLELIGDAAHVLAKIERSRQISRTEEMS